VNFFQQLSQPLLKALEKLGIEKPTLIQQLAFQPILQGENVLLIAPTGMGKTEAAVLPIFESLHRLRQETQLRGIAALYVTPLRSLNRDLFRRLPEVGDVLGIKIGLRHGDTPEAARKLQAEKPPHMLITTPETLQAILVGRKMRRHLSAVRWVVVDEIHEMADDKRGVQLSLALERLSSLTQRDFQRIGLSATIGEPETVARFLVGEGREVRILKAEAFRDVEAWVESPSLTQADSAAAAELLISAGTVARLRRILQLAQAYRSLLVFTNTREHAESLGSKLKALAPKLPLGIHHGSLSREVRVETERRMKQGALKVVVCTSSLELGIDIGTVDMVVQYQSPKQVVKLVQRIGRSGHAVAGRPKGCVLAAWPDDILESAVILKQALAEELERPLLHREALDVLAHQLVGLALDQGSLTLEEAYSTVRKAYPYRQLPPEAFMETVNQLKEERKLSVHGDRLRVKPPSSHQYYFENLSMIPEVSRFTVVDYAARRKIGSLDQDFVAKHGKPGNQFILHGSAWQVLHVDEERRVVEVEAVEASPAAIPAWEGEVIPVPYTVALEVGRLRREIGAKVLDGGDPLEPLSGYPLDEASKVKVATAIQRHVEEEFPLPHDRRVVVEAFENYTLIHGCFGDRANRGLSRVLAGLLTAKLGIDVAVQSDPYRMAFITPHALDPSLVEEELRSLRPEEASEILETILDQTSLFQWRLWNNAKRFGVISKKAEFRQRQAQALRKALRGTPVYKETFREIFLEDIDLETVQRVLAKIRSGEVEVETALHRPEPSPLALPLLDKIAPHDLLRPAVEKGEIIPMLKERLGSKTVKLLCVFKGDWEAHRRVSSLPSTIRCPRCNSTLIAVLNPKDSETLKTVKKKLQGKKLSGEEEKLWHTAWKNASLVQTYGKEAVIALSARGIGPATAVRILSKPHDSEEKFYAAILKAERTYLRTRMFWDTEASF